MPDADSALFNQAGKRCGRAHQKPAADFLKKDPVVADEAGKTQPAGSGGGDEIEREP